MAEKEKLAGVGWKLWMLGFPVREDHWRKPIEEARATLRRCTESVRGAINRDERRGDENTIYDLIGVEVLEGTPIYAATMRLPMALRSTAIRIAADILLGRFKADGARSKPLDPEEKVIINVVMGLSARMPQISGQTLDFSELPKKLEIISVIIGSLNRSNIIAEEPSVDIRRDFINAQATTIDLYHSTAWLFKGGFNLRTVERVLAQASRSTQAMMLIVWNRYRNTDLDFENSMTVTNIAKCAAQLSNLSNEIRRVVSDLPDGHPLGSQAQLRRAISKPKFLAEIIKSVSKFNELTIKSSDDSGDI